ncbi:unnamed protein product [Phyllotreta striolata]|uniref:Molybdopterin synthase catalytic subunit n=1 Tax=Phyllotreta striolata TaxID=444603 RepID=A0A9P0GTT4_PHYSR|nr:unnamed protein product [Phyllotreta striolata]
MNYLKLTPDRLSVDYITDTVSSNSCGAVSVFIGTTRDNFDGKPVTKLEYEAYHSMSLKCMEKICDTLREKWPSVVNIAIYHRLGEVPVKEASIIIAVSSPHRADAIKATEFCIDEVKKSVPIWKKEFYIDDSEPAWKENKESKKYAHRKFDVEQAIEAAPIHPHLVQIKASKGEIESRIAKFMERKRAEIDSNNIREFCHSDRDSEYTCARIDATVVKRTDSKSHLQVNRVVNSYKYRDQTTSNYLTKYIPVNGVEERLRNIEEQLSLTTPVSRNVYERLKHLEDRLLCLESISPEYIQFWSKLRLADDVSARKKVYSIDDINKLIAETERNIKNC